MTITTKFVTLLLLLAVVVVCVSPVADLDPTAMRSSQAAQALVMALALAAFLVLPFSVVTDTDRRLASNESVFQFQDDLLELNCIRTC